MHVVSGPSAPSGQQGRPDLSQAALAASVFRAPLSTCAGCCSERGSAATRRGQAPWGCGGCGGLRGAAADTVDRPACPCEARSRGEPPPAGRFPPPTPGAPAAGAEAGGGAWALPWSASAPGPHVWAAPGARSSGRFLVPLPPSPRCHSARVLRPNFNRRPCRHWFLSPWKWRCPLTFTGTSSGRRAAGSAR